MSARDCTDNEAVHILETVIALGLVYEKLTRIELMRRRILHLLTAVITFSVGLMIFVIQQALVTVDEVPTADLNMIGIRGSSGPVQLPEWRMCMPKVVDDSIRSINIDNYDINYGDVTKDGVEDAMGARGLESHGSAITAMVYVYGVQNHRAKVLWQFESGDRAYGGLKAIYAHCGDLIVELNGKNATPEDPYASEAPWIVDKGDGGACCPSYFTRTRYEWRKGRFRRKGKPEVFPLKTNP